MKNKYFFLFLTILFWVLGFPFAYYSTNLIPEFVSSTIVWCTWVPLLWVMYHSPQKTHFKIAYVTTFISYLGIMYWISFSMREYGNMGFLPSTLVVFLIAATLGFFQTLGLTWIFKIPFSKFWILEASAVLSLFEWIRVYFPLEGFPWTLPSYSLHNLFYFIQSADVIGSFGLTFFIYAVNLSIFSYFLKRSVKPILICLSLFVLFSVYGFFKVQYLQHEEHRNLLKVGVVQGNISQDQKWTSAGKALSLKKYIGYSKKLSSQNVDLIVWPEAAVTTTIYQKMSRLPFSTSFLDDSQLLFGAPSFFSKKTKRYYQNSAFLTDKNQRIQGRYDKTHLVPFGEYIPWTQFLPMDKFIPAVAGNFIKGKNIHVIQGRGFKAGILICYESLFPNLARNFVHNGADILLNITNDAWFNQTSGPYQHFQFLRFRSIETRRPVVRSANTGISGFWDHLGQNHYKSNLFVDDYFVASIHPQTRISFYVAYGYLLPFVGLFTLVCLYFRRRFGQL